MVRLLAREELSVAELQEILGMGQSRISMQLAQLKNAGLVSVRRAGQKSLYRIGTSEPIVSELVRRSPDELRDATRDDRALDLILAKRKDELRAYFDEVAGRFGRNYVPGRSWKSLAEMLLKLMPPMTIADLGAGEGSLALLLARQATRVIAVDHSEKMVEYGREIARRHGVPNLEYRAGDLEALPIAANEVDLALLHQSLHHALHPQIAVDEARRILRDGGRIVIMDLATHRYEQAREMYADIWLGFSQVELHDLLSNAGFDAIDVSLVHREEAPPHFETVLATAVKRAHVSS
jgi:ArsR family transcriptional regulator